ncbi:hypothetical protein Corgl_0765 [Coriobacterium glomerans PW2]|uniref:Uncharacterized protein n=1 Tax=Coriobacterium glomerans (strain ATCC 49209 / DSM 20642 / JCM 10262 / PW2) TaxID=700015 RepID=F2NBS0_CORGP|nr:hypothetical protein Corgl_0765 [Coriobacterium glomerans PW2]
MVKRLTCDLPVKFINPGGVFAFYPFLCKDNPVYLDI